MSPALDLRPPVVRRPPRRLGRWITIVVASLLVHLAVLDALPRWTFAPSDDDVDEHEPLRATLMPPVAAPPVEAPPAPAPVALPPRPRVHRPPPPAAATTFVPESFDPPQPVAATEGLAAPHPAPPAIAAPVPPGTPAPPAAPPVGPSPPTAPPPVAATPPRAARLDYKVVSQKVNETNPILGRGTIAWNFADGRYSVDLKAAAELFVFTFDVLSSHSEGGIGLGGLAPDRYTESPRRRSTVATNFNRDARQSITFSASSASVPLASGVQDRLSILFQVGAMLIADPTKGTAGTALEIPVAGVRGDVDTWRLDVRGDEIIDTGVGALPTVHLQRAPRPGSNDRTIDVWVAVGDGGYPARVLYTEPSGNTVMMTLDAIAAATGAAATTP